MRKSLLFLTLIGSFTACDDVSTSGNEDHQAVLVNTVDHVVIQTYESLNTEAEKLVLALRALETQPTQANLDVARQAWRSARVYWELAEGFLFGPVDQQGIDPVIDSWPVNEADLQAVLASGHVLDKAYVDSLEGTLKGFHTIEFLLFGASGDKTTTAFTVRELAYLRACGESLKGATQQLYDAWQPNGQHFGRTVKEAGADWNTVYRSQRSALQELVDGVITIADEVGNGKIQDPFAQSDVRFEESRFSANSKADFADNIRSIRNIYIGGMNNRASGASLSDLVRAENETTDAEIRAKIEAAISGIENIPGTFTAAIFTQRPAVQAAQIQVRALQQVLEEKLKPMLDNF